MRRFTRHGRRAVGALALVACGLAASTGLAGPINSDVAFTPREGGTIFRLRYIYSEAGAAGAIRHVNRSKVLGTYVFGLRSNLALILTVPYVNRQVDRVVPRLGRLEEAHDGVGDITFLLKYRFWQEDSGPQQTKRWAVLGGINIRSGDLDFSSDSYDPIVGTVYSWRRDRHAVDADLIYQFNTGRGKFRHDDLRYDLAYSYRFAPATFEVDDIYQWVVVAELNGRYSTNGSHEVFLSPGIQFSALRWTAELSVQLPVIQDLAPGDPETSYRLVLGMRWHW